MQQMVEPIVREALGITMAGLKQTRGEIRAPLYAIQN
jgi:hypothetical protein